MTRLSDRERWRTGVAHRIGMGGMVEFTPTKIGQTLHIPCARGHTVDFPITGNMPPDFVAKKMMQKGWTVGSKLLCPKHAKAKRTSAPPVEPKHIEKDEIMPSVQTAPAAPPAPSKILAPPIQTPAAAKAMRKLYLALDENYDEDAKRYKPGYDDKRISKDCDVAESVVAQVRENAYGPLGAPSDVSAFSEELKTMRALINEQADGLRNELRRLELRFETLQRKYG